MPNYVKVVPSIAIAFVSYEQVGQLHVCTLQFKGIANACCVDCAF